MTQNLLPSVDLHRATGRSANVLPKWIHLTPAGPEVKGRDGRGFTIGDPESVIEATELPLMIDLDHLSYFTGETKAYGWVDEIVFEDGKGKRAAGFWGRIERWTPAGEGLVRGRDYRYLSPVVFTKGSDDEDELGELVRFDSFALTNRPNLSLEELSGMHSRKPTPIASKPRPRGTPKAPTRVELEARIAELEAQRDREHAAELQSFRAKFGLRDFSTGQPSRAPITEEHAQRRAAFRTKFGLRDLSQPEPRAEAQPADARAAFKAKFGLV